MTEKLKIVLLITQMEAAGSQKALLILARGLQRHGHRVQVVTMYDKADYTSSFSRQYGVKIIDLNMKRAGQRNPLSRVGKFAQGLWRLYQLLRREHIDVLQTFSHYSNILGPMIGWLAGVPIRVSSQRSSLKGSPGWLLWLTRVVTNSLLVNTMVAVSEGTRQFSIEGQGIKPQKLLTIHNSIDVEHFTRIPGEQLAPLRVAWALPDDALIVLMVARLHPAKGHRFLLQAVPRIQKSLPQTHFLLVGDGELRPELETLAQTLGIRDRVHFLGVRQDIPELLSLCDLFVLPSLWEGLPNAVLEAMAAEKPVVATNVDGVPEVVRDNETGMLVPPGDIEALAQAIIRLLADPALRRQMGAAARQRAICDFSEEKYITSFVSLYQRLAERVLYMSTGPKRVSLLGAGLSLCDERELLAFIQEAIAAQRKVTILSGNIYSFNLAYEHGWLRQFFNQADIVRLDGAGVRLGARLLGHDTPARMTWADFGWSLADFAAQHGHSLFLLGSKPGIANTAAARLQAHSPALQIVGIHHGYFDKTTGSAENEAVLAQINAARPHILVVGFGMPLQERWLLENRARMDANVILTGGAVFDYISGELRRGPTWLTDHGMEWLARLLIEPRRLWKRYIIGNPLFLYRVLKQKFGLLRFNE